MAIMERTFETCQAAVAELDRREAVACTMGTELVESIAVLDPTTAHVILMSRDEFARRYRRQAERDLIAARDPRGAIRVVMLDGEGDGRSLLLADFKKVLDALELEGTNDGG